MNESDRRLSPDLADAIRLGDELANASRLFLASSKEDFSLYMDRFCCLIDAISAWEKMGQGDSARITREETTRT